jgi:hypothetical protein
MLNTTRLSGYWRDPYLWTIYEKSNKKESIDPHSPWNIGYKKNSLKIKDVKISNAPGRTRGWMIKFSSTEENNSNYDKLREKYSIGPDGLLSIKPSDDRIEKILQIVDEIFNW